MRCKRCGGVIDATVGECLKCGMRPPEEYTPYIRTMEDLAKEYYVPDDADSVKLPELFRDYEDKKTKLAKALETSADDQRAAVKGDPVIGLDEYARLLGVEDSSEISVPEESAEDALPKRVTAKTAELTDYSKDVAELHPLLLKIDRIIEKPADKVLEYIHEKHPQPARVKKSPTAERLMLLAFSMCAVIAVAALAVVIAMSIAPDISGEWLVAETAAGERLTVEFTNTGDVTARIYIDGEENIYLTGEYKIKRSNGSNLLTITYDDGSEKRLYYSIDKDSGSFTNVDSNQSDNYIRIK